MRTRGRRGIIAPRSRTTLVSGFVFVAGLVVMLIAPVPYAMESPGPTIDTLGTFRDVQLVTIDGAQVYTTEDDQSQLRMTTVVASGGPGFPVIPAEVAQGWLSPQTTVLPRGAIFAPEQTQDDVAEQGQAQMVRSQQDAAVMALTELGHDVPAVLTVTGAVPNTGAEGVAEAGDVLQAITVPDRAQVTITTYADLAEVLAATSPGTEVVLTVTRDGNERDLPITTGDDGFAGSTLGVFLSPDFDMPVQVHVDVENVGGPSAGMMLTLGIMDRLTPGDLTGGHVVAGTGTINLNGRIGPIGGIAQKMWGSVRDRAEYFLAPRSNCADVVGHIPDGLRVAAVGTLSEARDAVEKIAAGNGQELPGCPDDSGN